MRQHLIIDADDTLWENCIYFERAFAEFVAYLDHSHFSAEEVRAVLDEIELANARVHGYGSLSFGRNLGECYRRLAERHVGEDDLRTVMAFAERIVDHPVAVIEGVSETLEYLSLRHDLTLFTKGSPDEQRLKIDRSGLGPLFGHAAIVKEKDAEAYSRLVGERGMAPERAWMIGNSPKSDVNPALAAGLNAVFIPHPYTWVLEKQEIVPGKGKLLILERFGDLREHF